MPDSPARDDDVLTILAIAAIACILQDVLHEGLGHGVTAWFSGAHTITISTVALQSDVSTRWISAAGTLVNILAGAVLWLVLRRERLRPATRYFLVLGMAGNLFSGTGYFMFSGVMNFGDWAHVISGLSPPWAWRMALVVVGVAAYFASFLCVAQELRAFKRVDSRRLRRLCFIPYAAQGVLAGFAGLLNPLGMFYVIASALPSTLGANAGLLSLPGMMHRYPPPSRAVDPLDRSVGWIATATIAALMFLFVLGRGITLTLK